jgi:hypothetical protein
MRESRVFILKKYFPPIWVRIKKITFVYREKELYEHSSLGLWWKKDKGIGIKDEPLHFVHLMIGLHLIKHVTWFEFTYYKKVKTPVKGLVTSDPDKYLKKDL